MKKNNKTPKLRFSGYTDDWEQRKLSDIYASIGNAFVGTATPYYVESGHFYLESNNIKDGQINHNSEIFINDEFYEKQKDKWLHTGDMVMVQSGHVGHAAVIPEELDNSAAHALIMFRHPKEKIEPYFLNYQYQTNKSKKKIEEITTGNTIKHILASDMQEFVVDITNYDEQKKIGSYFQKLDHLITLHQRKLEKLQNMKKSCLQKMFPKDGATVPEIRFSEFQEDWEERTLGSCFDERLESLPDGELLSVTIGSGIKKFSELDRHDNSNTDKSKYKRVCIGDIAYNSMRMWQGASGRSPYEGIVSPAYTVVKPIGDIDTQFFAYMFKKKGIIHLFEINSQGLTSDTWNLKYPAFSKIVVKVPRNVEEQSRIARFLLELDELISCTEQEIEITKRMKKGCLQKMFV